MGQSLSITLEHATANIAAIRAVCSPAIVNNGREWYAQSRAVCVSISDSTHGAITVAQVADCMSVLSPQKSWLQNVEECAAFIRDYCAGILPTQSHAGMREHRAPFCTRSQRAKLESILDGHNALRGRKVESFRANILYRDSDSVTVDSWAMRVARNDPANSGAISSDAVYRIVERAYVNVAYAHNERPYQTQAIAWVLFRALYATHHSVLVDIERDAATRDARADRVAIIAAIAALAPAPLTVTAPTRRRAAILSKA